MLEIGLTQNASTREDYWLGSERGPYSTGTIEDFWVDENRGELTTADPTDKRHVMVQIWYPTEASDGEKASYVLTPELFGESARWWLDPAV
jgi:hypothetical protein